MSAAVKNSSHEFPPFDAWGRRIRCVTCGVKLKHPHEGRPRINCGRRECINAWKRVRSEGHRRRQRDRWTDADREEARWAWKGRCATCLGARYIKTDWAKGILPVHEACAKTITDQAKAWLARCKPGCPLPNPWKGGAP